MKNAKELDQFYTNPAIAVDTVRKMKTVLRDLDYHKPAFLEPSAGAGAFLKALAPDDIWYAGDLEPAYEGVLEKNFLEDSIPVNHARDELVVFGNPPFGKRAQLAIDFLNKSFSYSDTVAFILPLQFRKYATQRKINSLAQLVYDEICPSDSFIFKGKPYDVRCSFQIWTLKENSLKNLRMLTAPPTNHPDFSAWIYNATKEAEVAFDQDWEYAVRRQGWGSFEIISRAESVNLSRKIQWMLIKPLNEEARKNILSIDYESLAKRNTSVMGFGKADLVDEYTKLFGNKQKLETGLFANSTLK